MTLRALGILLAVLALAGAVLLPAVPAQGQTPPSPTPTPAQPTLLWKYQVGESVNGVAVSADGTRVAAGTAAPSVYASRVVTGGNVYSLDWDGKLLWKYQTGESVNGVAVSADGSQVAAGSNDGYVYLLDGDGKLLWQYGAGGPVYAVAVSADGSRVAAGSNDNYVHLLDGDGRLLWKYNVYNSVVGVGVSADSAHVAAVALTYYVYLLDRDGKLLWKYLMGNSGWAVGVSADGARVAAGSRDGYVYLLDRDGKLLRKYQTGESGIGVAVSADGARVAIGTDDGYVYLLDRDGKLLWKYLMGNSAWAVAVSADGARVAAGTDDGYVYLLDFPAAIAASPGFVGRALDYIHGELHPWLVLGTITLLGIIGLWVSWTRTGQVLFLSLALRLPINVVKMSAVTRLGNMKYPGAIEPVLAALKYRGDLVALNATVSLQKLSKLKDPRAVRPLVKAVLKDPDYSVRTHALELLGQLREFDIIHSLEVALKDSKASVRQHAIYALNQLGHPDPWNAELYLAAAKDSDATVRREAARALRASGSRGGQSAVDTLVTMALKDPDSHVQEAAISALLEIKNPRSVEALLAALKDADSKVSASATHSLWNVKESWALEPLLTALNDSDNMVRRHAAYFLGQIKDQRALKALRVAMKDPDASVKEIVQKSLLIVEAVEQQRVEEERRRRKAAAKAEAERVAAAEAEAQRKAAMEADARRKAAAEQAERQRQAEVAQRKAVAEAEAQRKAAAEARRKASLVPTTATPAAVPVQREAQDHGKQTSPIQDFVYVLRAIVDISRENPDMPPERFLAFVIQAGSVALSPQQQESLLKLAPYLLGQLSSASAWTMEGWPWCWASPILSLPLYPSKTLR